MPDRPFYGAVCSRGTRDRASHGGIALALVAAFAAAGGAFVAAIALFPAAQVLPATAMGLILAAAATAAIAWMAPPEVGRARIVFWDIAGALAVIGLCAAALIGEPEPAVALIERQR